MNCGKRSAIKGMLIEWVLIFALITLVISNIMVMPVQAAVNPTSVKLNKTSLSIKVGKTYTLKAKITPKGSYSGAVTFKSDDDSIATVTSKGQVRGVKSGTTTITASTSNGKKATCKVKVRKKDPTGITLNHRDLTIKVGESIKLKATVTPKKNSDLTVKYESDDKDIISVSSSGVVKGLNEGTCSIVVTTVNGLFEVCSVTVIEAGSTSDGSSNSGGSTNKVEATGITMDKTALVSVGGQYNLSTVVSPSNATNKTVTYTVSNDNITVSDKGIVTGKKVGQSVVTARTSNGLTTTCVVTVTASASSSEVTQVYLNRSAVTIKKGGQFTLKPTLYPSTAVDNNIKYYSSNPTVAYVTDQGLIIGLEYGTSIITVVTSNGKTNTCVVTVSDQEVEISSIQFTQTSATVKVNQYIQLSTYIYPSNASDSGVSYYAADSNVATVSQTGLVTGLKAGTTKIYAITNNGRQAECTITVTDSSVSTLSVKGVQIALGDTTNTVISKLGSPSRIDITEYNFSYYVYNNDSNNLVMIAISNSGKVVGFYTDALSFSFAGISQGMTVSNVNTALGQNYSLSRVNNYATSGYTMAIFFDTLGNGTVIGTQVFNNDVIYTGHTDSSLTSYENEMVDMINSMRARNGRAVLTATTGAAKAAKSHSLDMATRNYLDSKSPEGLTPYIRLLIQGLSVTSAGENIGTGENNVAYACNSWLNTASYRINILSSDYQYMGVGAGLNSSRNIYYTADFYR